MEAIFLIIGELVFAILAPLITIVVEAVGAAISALIALLSGRSSGQIFSSGVARLIAVVLAVLAGIALMLVLLVNFFFFEDAARYVLGKVESRTEIATGCDAIDGSLLSGRVTLVDCSIRRPSHPSSSFELAVAKVEIDLRLTSMLGTATLDSASVEDMRGWVRAERNRQPDSAGVSEERPRREFEIMNLHVANVDLRLAGLNPDGNSFEVPIEIQRLDVAPLRSRLALFDLLFRSNAAGMLDGAPFELASSEIAEGRRTEWRAAKVPIASFGAMTGGVLSWFSSGFVDVHVDDEWQRSDATTIDMDWRLRFSDIEVSPPSGTGAVTRFVTAPLTRYVNGFDGEFPLEFAMVLNENQFEYQSSLAAAGVWSAVGAAADNALSLLGIDTDASEDTGETLKESMKSILDRARKPDDQD